MRIKFAKGLQRKFLEEVLIRTACPSLMELSRRVNVNYQTLKNYYIERRLLPRELFELFCKTSNLEENGFSFEELPDNFGQIKGGKNTNKN